MEEWGDRRQEIGGRRKQGGVRREEGERQRDPKGEPESDSPAEAPPRSPSYR